jgi:hypothetical protein
LLVSLSLFIVDAALTRNLWIVAWILCVYM